MAAESSTTTNPKNGFCPQTKIYHSLRRPVPLPPPSQHLSISQYTLSLLHSSTTATSSALSTTPFVIDASTSNYLTYSAFLRQVDSLSASLKPLLSKNDVAFILSPPSLHIPVLYFSLLSLGVAISPANPLSSPSELAHQTRLCRPAVAFATAEASKKLPRNLPIIDLDSPQFLSMLNREVSSSSSTAAVVDQSSTAAIFYSSGTTGNVKGVVLTHRNFIALTAGLYHNNTIAHEVSFFTLPLFHVFGFSMLMRAAALGNSVVLRNKFDFVGMLAAVERHRVTSIQVSPPLVVAFLKSDLVDKHDLSSLQILNCGGARLGREISERFRERFPHVEILQGYGLTENTGGAARTIGPEETRYGSVGRLSENIEAKIVDPKIGDALPPGQSGELWLRGLLIMKGYAGDDAATAATLDSQGWLKTGDLCYFDEDGFLFIVDRLKELIKYKAYQVPPAELEHLLQSIPEIDDAAVVPYPDEEAGQIPMACVVTKPGNIITATQIMDYIAKQVAPYKKIRRVVFINSIPKNPSGKILRRELISQVIYGTLSKL